MAVHIRALAVNRPGLQPPRHTQRLEGLRMMEDCSQIYIQCELSIRYFDLTILAAQRLMRDLQHISQNLIWNLGCVLILSP